LARQLSAFEGERTIIVGVLALNADQNFVARTLDGRGGFDTDEAGHTNTGVPQFGHRLATESEYEIVLSLPGELVAQTDPAEGVTGLATERERTARDRLLVLLQDDDGGRVETVAAVRAVTMAAVARPRGRMNRRSLTG
jgi:hypothetical protein